MKLKKWQLIVLHILILTLLFLCAVKYAEEIQTLKETVYYTLHPIPVAGETNDQYTLYPATSTGDEWYADAPLIYHAGGSIDGYGYTNSREALEKTLADGNDFIEIDLRYTSDHHLVCAHDWADVYPEAQAPTLEEFLNSKIQGKFTPMTAEDLIGYMRANPEMHLTTDVKSHDLLVEMITELVQIAGEDPDILSRFIIQLYTGREKTEVQAIYPFDDAQFLFTLYEWGVFQHEVIAICNEENINVITVESAYIASEDVALMRDLGFTVYTHTVNRVDLAQRDLERGVSGFYTDLLQPADLDLAR